MITSKITVLAILTVIFILLVAIDGKIKVKKRKERQDTIEETSRTDRISKVE